MGNQPFIAASDQDHGEAVRRCLGFAITNSSEFVEPSYIGDIVIKQEDLADADRNLVAAVLQTPKIFVNRLAAFVECRSGRADQNGVRRVEFDQSADIIGVE